VHLKTLTAAHGDLYGTAFWHDMQTQIRRGEIIDIFPYPAATRLRP
jgi:isocitrate dehydrogenase kinase/phosphatase